MRGEKKYVDLHGVAAWWLGVRSKRACTCVRFSTCILYVPHLKPQLDYPPGSKHIRTATRPRPQTVRRGRAANERTHAERRPSRNPSANTIFVHARVRFTVLFDVRRSTISHQYNNSNSSSRSSESPNRAERARRMCARSAAVFACCEISMKRNECGGGLGFYLCVWWKLRGEM